MKIRNLTSGKCYQLSTDINLKIERPNPFFNDYGEQSLPISIPDSPYNRELLGLSGMEAGANKPSSLINASIEDGELYIIARQAILSIEGKGDISTSFYMNEGSLYSKLTGISITDIFKDETIAGVTTVDEGIAYMTNLLNTGSNDKFAVFAIEIESDLDKDAYDRTVEKYLNKTTYNSATSKSEFVNAVETTEMIDEKKIINPPGYYMTPFVKCNYVLSRLFSHFGYTLNPNLFTTNEQFKGMVLVNNVADAIVNGTILVSQLLPQVKCSDIIDLFRKKFCCEFIPHEIDHTIDIVLLKDILSSSQSTDLSAAVIDNIKIEFPTYKHLHLKAAESIDTGISNPDNLADIKTKYPTAYFNHINGCFQRHGFEMEAYSAYTGVYEIVVDSNMAYLEDGEMEAYEVEIPEAIPSNLRGSLYVGKGRFLNSKLLPTGTIGQDTQTADKTEDMPMMLAFDTGTITNYYGIDEDWQPKRVGDYSLAYNGADGIFEKFYRPLDDILRNSYHSITAKLILNDDQKTNLRPYEKVNIKGCDCIINTLNFNIGRNQEPIESSFFTTSLHAPVASAKTTDAIFPLSDSDTYEYVKGSFYQALTNSEYDISPYKNIEIPNVYPPTPTADMMGKHIYEAKSALDKGDGLYILYTFWLEVRPKNVL